MQTPRGSCRQAWGAAASAYGLHLPTLAGFDGPLAKAAGIGPGSRVLDLGTGPGEPALALAGAVGPGGSILGVDIAEAMVQQARRRAQKAGARNASFRVMDAQALELPDGVFDAVLHRFGPQLLADPRQGLVEARRVLRPGGRLAAVVWAAPGDRVPLLDVLFDPLVRHAEPDGYGGIGEPYALGATGELAGLMEAVGFEELREAEIAVDMTYASQEVYFRAFLEGTPLGGLIHAQDVPVQEAIFSEAAARLRRWRRDDGQVAAPATGRLVAGTRPAGQR